MPPQPFDFSPFDAVLLDLDGTVYKEETPLPGAADIFRRLAQEGRTTATLSNSTQSPARLCARLARMGILLAANLIFTASEEAAEYVLQRFAPQPRVFNLATEGIHEMLDGKVTWTENEHAACDCVMIGNPACTYATPPRMQMALRLLRQGAACIGLCDDRLYPSSAGEEIGSGATTRMFAYAADVQPIFFGKPRPEFFLKLCRRLAVLPEKCVLIGDNLESDIAGAKGVGMKTILSLTGVTRRSDLANLPGTEHPDWIVNDLREL